MMEQTSPIVIPEQWSSAAAAIATASLSDRSSSPPVVFICGAKNSGKSTLSRLLLNSLVGSYRKVVYLDTDVGQLEFTTPGCLSFHLIHEQNPDAFSLVIFLQKEIQKPIWIVYCDFMVITSWSILRNNLRALERSHYLLLFIHLDGLKIRISMEEKNLPLGEFWLEGSRRSSVALIDLYAARCDSLNKSVLTKKSGRHSRDVRIIAYFRQCLPGNLSITTNKELAHAMASLPPYEIFLTDVKVQHFHCQVPSNEVFHSLNATIVGLARSSKNSEVPESSLPWCVGLGLVRAVDASKQIVYVITPVPLWHLEKVDDLLQGFIEIPTCLLQVCGCISPYMSTNVISLHPIQT